ncbi:MULTISPECIES: asparaginase [unclassified Streptomyces]|uniref:asparaginase n=1 Tax=unclassified Streptomyces TaxID=2593676 RepID=UPI002DDBDE6B|nr:MULTISPECIES: asparaginase [unclassified Streptomyces]WSA90705.1 asparaginase [Streptomyces sp. NBC_01795]WSS16691.1 asparaginase [Streptomyces sp. NBC_01186]WSS45509.1 asparaginase [Streptomyces sp. NBC_01187]
MRHIVLLSTGGTIATRNGAAGRRVEVGARELLGSQSGAPWLDGVRIDARDAASFVSFAAGIPEALSLAESVREATAEADAVVVTHGTDTLEESAFLLALTHGGPEPVVFTGAQRPFDDPAPDGPRNLATALRWAATAESDGTGVTVAFADGIWPAVGVRKTHALAVDAFGAPGRGPVGRVDEGGVRRYGSAPREVLLPPDTADLPRVDVIGQYLGVDGSAVRHAVREGARGLVVAGFGSGNTTPATTEACVHLLGEGVPVLVSSRTGEGAVTGLYAGGSAELAAAGAVFAGDLSPWQARLLLAAALAAEDSTKRGADGMERVTRRCRDWLRATGAVPREDPARSPLPDPAFTPTRPGGTPGQATQ